MRHEVGGDIAQYACLEFAAEDFAWASKGSIMSLSSGMQWTLRVPGGASGAVRRMMSGEGLALVYLQAGGAGESALLAANAPGHIEAWNLGDGPVTTTRGSFLSAWGDDIDINVTVARRVGAALFGGAGLFLQQVSGRGTVLIHGSGDLYERRLGDGEQMLVSTGNLAAFSHGVEYDIQGVGGCRKMLFGGEGVFMTRLRGPGRVILQTLKRTHGRSSAPPSSAVT